MHHRQRPQLVPRLPVHVTVKLAPGLPRLHGSQEQAALLAAFAAGCAGPTVPRGRFRLCWFAILDDHLHLLIEAADRPALARGVQGLLVRVARRLNRLWQRRGKVFADRYHDRVLATRVEARRAELYLRGHGGRKFAPVEQRHAARRPATADAARRRRRARRAGR